MAVNKFFETVVGVALVVLIRVTLVTSMPAQKPDGNTINMNYLGSVDGKSFFAEVTPKRSWESAKQYCQQSGMKLASVDSAAQVALLVRSYNSATFTGSLWTAGRDARAASQFVWDNSGNILDENVNKFVTILAMQTCVHWHFYNSGDGHTDSALCTILFGVICEITSG